MAGLLLSNYQGHVGLEAGGDDGFARSLRRTTSVEGGSTENGCAIAMRTCLCRPFVFEEIQRVLHGMEGVLKSVLEADADWFAPISLDDFHLILPGFMSTKWRRKRLPQIAASFPSRKCA